MIFFLKELTVAGQWVGRDKQNQGSGREKGVASLQRHVAIETQRGGSGMRREGWSEEAS